MAYEFQFITDDRFGGTKEQLEEMDNKLKFEICRFGGYVSLKEMSGIRLVSFPSESRKDGHSYQWRKNYRVDKMGRHFSWSDVFYAINQIQAVPYDKVKKVILNA